jgi:hypothetical protein
MCNLPDEAEGGAAASILAGSILALAYHLVPWMENIPGVPGDQ